MSDSHLIEIRGGSRRIVYSISARLAARLAADIAAGAQALKLTDEDLAEIQEVREDGHDALPITALPELPVLTKEMFERLKPLPYKHHPSESHGLILGRRRRRPRQPLKILPTRAAKK